MKKKLPLRVNKKKLQCIEWRRNGMCKCKKLWKSSDKEVVYDFYSNKAMGSTF